MVITKLQYAAPLWLNQNLDIYQEFWNQAMMKITGSMLYPNRDIIELALHLPPLHIQLEILNVKFFCKILSGKDFATATLAQAEGSLYALYHNQLTAVRKYLVWRNGVNGQSTETGRSQRHIDIMQMATTQNVIYTKEDIIQHQQNIWIDHIRNKLMQKTTTRTNLKVTQIIDKLSRTSIILHNNNSLFNHGTSKKEDSIIMDYLHGNSLLFGRNRYTITGDESEKHCVFCDCPIDTPKHQLLECNKLADSTQYAFASSMINSRYSDYIQEVLVPTDKKIQNIFIERIRFMVPKQDSYNIKACNISRLALEVKSIEQSTSIDTQKKI